MKKKPNNWALKLIKRTKNGGLSGTFSYTKQEKGVTNTEEWNFKHTENPHPDLIEKLDELKPALAKCYDMDAIVMLANSKGLKIKDEDAFKQVKDFIDGAYAEVLKKIEINGIAISGQKVDDNDDRSVVIMGTKLMENGSKAAFNSPCIKLSKDYFTTEDVIQDLVNELDEEVSAYIYEGKKEQLEMFNQPKEEKHPEPELA